MEEFFLALAGFALGPALGPAFAPASDLAAAAFAEQTEVVHWKGHLWRLSGHLASDPHPAVAAMGSFLGLVRHLAFGPVRNLASEICWADRLAGCYCFPSLAQPA